ncbi:MAG: sporulation protein YqfD [Blautia sp.]|nr:sporulation protein YqfD [Blautia sp.]MDY5031951.1 sporulation protein YqfD [Blautia sp.]
MGPLEEYIRGTAVISVTGEELVRFLALCANHGIEMKDVIRISCSEIRCRICSRDFRKLRQIRKKTGVHIQIRKKQGMPFFLLKNRKRKAFFIGTLAAAGILYLLSSRIWTIHIQGNQRNSTPMVREWLKQNGLYEGIRKNKINCFQVAEQVRADFPDITWVSVKIHGSRLEVTVKEGLLQKAVSDQEEQGACDLVADRSGIIEKIITRSGVPLVAEGDHCSKGDILVSGKLELRDDSQEVIRTELVHADADIWIRYARSYYYELPYQYSVKTIEDTHERVVSVRLWNWILDLDQTPEADDFSVSWEIQPRITESLYAPMWIRKARIYHCRVEEKEYSQKEAKEKVMAQLRKYEQKLMEKGVQISENNVKIEFTDTACISRGSLTVTEKAQKEAAVSVEE